MLRQFNQWYDSIKEPWRFCFAVGLCLIGIVPASISRFGWWSALGWLWLIILLLVRIHYQIKKEKEYE